ncbi:hypothetical protein TNCV_4196281 [Trichonephila clavipes]|nr:hypothetical protein TNCV_4196281 [Trichonephila clavipes]
MERGQKYTGRDRIEGMTINNMERGKRRYCPKEPEILQGQTRRSNPPHQQSNRKIRMEADRNEETRRSTHRGHSATEGRRARSRRKPTVRHLAHII